MTTFDGLPKLLDVITQHDLAAKKSLGQNFLLDLNLTSRIARQAGDLSNFTVIEIGPGPGGLTRALLANGARRVVAIERDERCLSVLDEIKSHFGKRFDYIHGDALKTNIATIDTEPTKIVANLPYNIATALLLGWLLPDVWPPAYQSLTLMFQKEVAERICAEPGSKAYGRLSVIAQWRCSCKLAFDVSPKAFMPPPKVTSSIVHLVPRPYPLKVEAKKLETVTRHAFGQRRKMLRASLKPLGGEALLEKAGIDGKLRAETLTFSEFVAIANAI